MPDLNRLCSECRWNVSTRRMAPAADLYLAPGLRTAGRPAHCHHSDWHAMLIPSSPPKASCDPRIGPLAQQALAVPVPLTHPFRPHPGVKGAPQDAEAERLLHLLHEHFTGLGHEMSRCQLELPDAPRPLVVDLLDLTTRQLIVGRGTTARPAVQEAIGELLDLSGLFHDTFAKTLLLPHPPEPGLNRLFKRLDITATWPVPTGFRDSRGRTA